MPYLNLKTTQELVRDYYKALKKVQQLSLLHHPTYRETYVANLRRELTAPPWIGSSTNTASKPTSAAALPTTPTTSTTKPTSSASSNRSFR